MKLLLLKLNAAEGFLMRLSIARLNSYRFSSIVYLAFFAAHL